jgi:M6 family metalloprotease-like protein
MTVLSSRFLRTAAAAGLLLLAGAVALLGSRAFASPDPSPSGPVRPAVQTASAPGARTIGLTYFQVEPDGGPSLYELLAIPVRFPEDDDLGGGGRDSLLAALKGTAPGTLESFYQAITFGRIRMRVTLAPTVVAEHPRSWYTSEGEGNRGYGLDVDAYPHNSRGLVEEVTTKVTTAVDLRRFDNTGDGIVDGLLILHSGPPAPEVLTPGLPQSVMLAHSFTLDVPVRRDDAWIFPYAVASTYDPLGPWAHEVGHLFGLVDLYVPNSFCPGEGLGAWSLMATGANQDGGADPTGLDAFSLQLLGFPPVIDLSPSGYFTLGRGTFLRFFRAGQSRGPEYFLVQRRLAAAEPGLTDDATLIFSVDETMVDNRTCGRPLVALRGVIGPGTTGEIRLDDDTDPSLRDRDGEPTNLWLWLDGDAAAATGNGDPTTDLVSVRLGPPRPGEPGGSPVQTLDLTVRNIFALKLFSIDIEVFAPEGGDLCVSAPGGVPNYELPIGGEVRDTSWVVTACAGTDLPVTTADFEIVVGPPWGTGARRDTVTLAVNQSGLGADRLRDFTAVNLAPGRANPWTWDADGNTWTATALGVLADAEIQSPWFTVPEGGALVLEHAWDLDAVAPDLALDAAEIRLETQLTADADLKPSLGWGHVVERGVGNALGGRDALSGAGERVHVFDLAAHARETVRLKLRAAGDVEGGDGLWRIARAVVANPASEASFTFTVGADRILTTRADGTVPDDTRLTIYSGPTPLTPSALLAQAIWDGAFAVTADGDPGKRRRFDLVWEFSGGGGGTRGLDIELPPEPRALLPPYPNPLRPGALQTWSLEVPPGSAPGVYHFLLVDAAGRRMAERQARFDLLGRRAILWDGRDFAGRPVPAGVYFLQVRSPEGRTESRRLVVLP